MNRVKINNCMNCFYANLNEELSVDCDKKFLLTGKMYHVKNEDVQKPCPAHSHILTEESRYMRNNKWLHESEEGDYCQVCRRQVDLDDITQYNYIETQDDECNVNGEILQCRICKGKGRS